MSPTSRSSSSADLDVHDNHHMMNDNNSNNDRAPLVSSQQEGNNNNATPPHRCSDHTSSNNRSSNSNNSNGYNYGYGSVGTKVVDTSIVVVTHGYDNNDYNHNNNNSEHYDGRIPVAPYGTTPPPTTKTASFANHANENLNRFPSCKQKVSRDAATTIDAALQQQQQRKARNKTQKTPSASFGADLLHFTPGSIPHSTVMAVLIGTVCGVAAWLYYAVLEWALQVLWKRLPEHLVSLLLSSHSTESESSSLYYDDWSLLQLLWIPIAGLTLATGVGLSVQWLGEPGDLAYTVRCVHETGGVGLDHVAPMAVSSLCSILAGGSLGPEAPLVAVCAALAGAVSRFVNTAAAALALRPTTVSSSSSLSSFAAAPTTAAADRNLLRKHTLMGMSGALSAFFGCPLGGSLFALEVCSRFGIEYFEHTIEAIFAGEVCLAVFRTLAGLPIRAIWDITENKLPSADPVQILYGAGLGLAGAATAYLYAQFHWQVMHAFRLWGLLDSDNRNAVRRAWAGATVVVALGVLVPQTFFWGEFEFQAIATMAPVAELPHIWPAASLIRFEMHNFVTALTVGVAKLIAISFTVAGGYRGGYIFPLFSSGAALGRAVYYIVPVGTIPVQLCVLCMAAAVNVAVTRTALATTLILAYLSGEPNAISAILAASLVSLFATGYMPFIASQVSRFDLESSLYHYNSNTSAATDCNNYDGDSESGETEALTPFSDVHKHMGDDDNHDSISLTDHV